MVGIHSRLTYKKYWTNDCIGYNTVDEVLLKYIRDALHTSIGKNIPLFLMAWLSNLSHANMNALNGADGIYADFLKSSDLNNTILFFMSDHGSRYGEFRQTLPGWYEDKLPNFWVYLPSSLRQQFPDWLEAVKVNSRYVTYNVLYRSLNS